MDPLYIYSIYHKFVTYIAAIWYSYLYGSNTIGI